MKPSFLNLFMKKLTRDRVVPIISDSVSYQAMAIAIYGIRLYEKKLVIWRSATTKFIHCFNGSWMVAGGRVAVSVKTCFAAGGRSCMWLRKVTVCQICCSLKTLYQPGMAVQRSPGAGMRNF